MNSRSKSNDALRKKLELFLKKIKSGEQIYTNHIIIELSKLNRNYSIPPQRVYNLLKENSDVKFIKSGVWLKL